MEVMLIHKPMGILPPEKFAASIEIAKMGEGMHEEVAPGARLIASYPARMLNMCFCLWDVPVLENLVLVVEPLRMLGWDTEIIPVEKMEVAIPKLQAALQTDLAKQ